MTIKGWFFDVYPVHNGMIVWLIDNEGRAQYYFDPFHPSFYLHLESHDEKRIPALVQKLKLPVTIGKERKFELFSDEEWDVTTITVHDPLQFNECVSSLQRFFPHFAFYNSNIPVAQLYLYDRQVFPLARCEFIISDDNILTQIVLNDSFDAWNYQVPDLRIMTLRNEHGAHAAKFFKTLKPELSYEGTTYTIEGDDPVEVLQALNWHLHHYDPDVIISSWGDATLLPTLLRASLKYRIPLLLNRDQSQEYFTIRERSYWTYGQIIHRDAAFMLAGRWHIDAENSFIMGESDIEGIIELSRLTQLPIQKQSRASIGTGLASMQMSYAYRNNILIPAEKKEGEDFKTADALLLSDRGGLIFMPERGYHENVAELDFASMYPSLMEMHNISPETINCPCCHPPEAGKVPELGYTICEKRRGIVPTTLKPVLEKRAYYKARKKSATTLQEYQKYDRRQNALKWMLVTCFGYLGYKNARFGRIEAHESVNAFSREALLTAKEIAEAQGYHLIHAIVDCLWLKKAGARDEDYQHLCEQIQDAVGVNISLEGIYNWIVFPASKMDPVMPTANRYAGWYRHGELKMRGIEARRRDMPKFIKNMQTAMLEQMSQAYTIEELKASVPALLETARGFVSLLRAGNVNPMELVLRRHITKEADEYTNNSISAVVTKLLEDMGIHLAAGESIEFIIIDQSGKKQPEKAKPLALYALEDGYDIEKYTELLLKAVETLLLPFGYDVETLKAYFASPGQPDICLAGRQATEARPPKRFGRVWQAIPTTKPKPDGRRNYGHRLHATSPSKEIQFIPSSMSP